MSRGADVPKMTANNKLWNRNFLLLWQGQLVSALGDAVYRIALGFWILEATGSTALMGALMAVSVVPRVLLSPLSGAVADRADRKWILVACDSVAGLTVAAVGLAALAGVIEVWMVFTAAVVLGAVSSLFDPTVLAAVSDLVPPRQLTRANSALSVLATATAIVGNAVGGFLFQLLGAPLLFLVNGLSFLLSAGSEVFIRLAPVQRSHQRSSYRDDIQAGLRLVWRRTGLRYLYLITGAANFFSTMIFVLILPLFQRSEQLGAGRYGLLMSALSVGAFSGFVLCSTSPFAPAQRFRWLIGCAIAEASCFLVLPWLEQLAAMMVLVALAGMAMAVQNTLVTTALQLQIPANMRGKAFGLRAALMMSLGAFGMAAGGVLAETISLPLLISGAAAAMILGAIALAVAPDVKEILNDDSAKRHQDSV